MTNARVIIFYITIITRIFIVCNCSLFNCYIIKNSIYCLTSSISFKLLFSFRSIVNINVNNKESIFNRLLNEKIKSTFNIKLKVVI